MNNNKVLENANIPREWWELCIVDGNKIYVPTPKELFEKGIINEDSDMYKLWLNNENKPISQPDKISVLEKENKLLKAQVEVLSQTADFHEELIVEMANKVYA